MTGQTDVAYIKQRVEAHWDRRAAEFDQQASHGLLNEEQAKAWHGVLLELAPPPPLDVLDVGCGTGFLALQLAALGHFVTGLDLAAEMVGQARRKAEERRLKIAFVEGDAEEPNFPEETFDLITARHLIWTLPRPDVAVRSWLMLLRPGGRIALVEGEFNSASQVSQPEYEDIYDKLPLYRGRSGAELTAFLESCGVAKVEIHPLMDVALWGSPPDRERYLAVGYRP